MHSHNIVHRDLKPENVVMSNVISSLFREFAKFVILVGLQYVKIVDKLIAEL
jgi:serine/threonine protein kinase